MNICAKCRFFKRNGPIWYDQFCLAVENEPAIDPQTGEKGWAAKNDLGRRLVTNQQHPYARDINPSGECSLYRERGVTYTDEASIDGVFAAGGRIV